MLNYSLPPAPLLCALIRIEGISGGGAVYPERITRGGNWVFGKLPSHQMAVAIIVLIGKKIREINFGYRALPYILCAYKYIQCL